MEHVSSSVRRLMPEEGVVLNLPSTCSENQRSNSSRKPTAAIRNLIGQLALRYPATSNDDLDAHRDRLNLLAFDLADMPPKYLERAISAWAVRSPWLPKAFDLVELAKDFAAEDRAASTDTRTLAQRYNDRMAADPLARPDRKWIDLPDGGVKLVPK